MVNYIYLITLSLFFLNESVAQLQAPSIPVRNEVGISAGFQGKGFSFNLFYGMLKNRNQTWFLQAGFSELKSSKERRVNYDSGIFVGNQSSKSFIYGKRNNLYALRLGSGHRFYISDKSNNRALALAFSYVGGFSLGLLKPYYLNLIDNTNLILPQAYSDENRSLFLNPSNVRGPSGFSYGWDDLSLTYGAYAKAALLFDWGAFDQLLKSMELGVALNAFYRGIPLMVDNQHSPVFASIYLSFSFGKRW